MAVMFPRVVHLPAGLAVYDAFDPHKVHFVPNDKRVRNWNDAVAFAGFRSK